MLTGCWLPVCPALLMHACLLACSYIATPTRPLPHRVDLGLQVRLPHLLALCGEGLRCKSGEQAVRNSKQGEGASRRYVHKLAGCTASSSAPAQARTWPVAPQAQAAYYRVLKLRQTTAQAHRQVATGVARHQLQLAIIVHVCHRHLRLHSNG